jgi:hypothetical protein
MIRVSAVALLAVAAVVTVACADNILKERPSAKATHAAAAVRPAFSATGSAKGQSSVCGAYRRQLRVAELRRATTADRALGAQLKAKELSLNAIIADACE